MTLRDVNNHYVRLRSTLLIFRTTASLPDGTSVVDQLVSRVTSNQHVLVAYLVIEKIEEYTPTGTLVRELALSKVHTDWNPG